MPSGVTAQAQRCVWSAESVIDLWFVLRKSVPAPILGQRLRFVIAEVASKAQLRGECPSSIVAHPREKRLSEVIFVLALNGLIWGLIIALIALGLSIIFGLLDIINIAHGDFFMIGTMIAWATVQQTGNFWLAFIVAPLIGFILGT